MTHGDKILCIKEFECGSYSVGKYYKIVSTTAMVKLGCPEKIPAVVVEDDFGDEWYFSRDDKMNYSFINKYFIAVRLERKLKLKKINEKQIF